MAMSRKHYIKAAKIVRAFRLQHPPSDPASGMIDITEDLLVDLFRSDNPAFREAQFRQACQPGGEGLERVSRKQALAEGWVRPWEGEQ